MDTLKEPVDVITFKLGQNSRYRFDGLANVPKKARKVSYRMGDIAICNAHPFYEAFGIGKKLSARR
ncbi:hypothetical protein [Mesorhizobium ventifaucium]|uniref:hypothetical protein n=1 Tax=Mesorhizobium ventifaucium TaxID=666020 RepID=UPI0020A736E1|nr:hypothetical protein [Mesorhizobium ventifaucium]